MQRSRAFSLVEIALALGIIAFALVAIVGLIPTALRASREAVELTRTSMIAQDAAMRLPTLAYTDSTATMTATWFYDQYGHWVTINSSQAAPYASAFYRVDIARGNMGSYPANADPSLRPPSDYPPYTDPALRDPSNSYSTRLLAATATIRWPLNPATGVSIGSTYNIAVYPLLTRAMP